MTRTTLVLLLAALAITATVRLGPSQSLTAGRTPPNASTRPLDGSARLLDALSRSAKEEMAFPNRTGGGDPSPPSAPGLLMALGQEAGGTKVGGVVPAAPSADSLASSATLDLRDFALATPALRPLASDCRLPCYGIERRGPASYYTDPRYGPRGYYAAIPGYLGVGMSVVVCTFPDGKANCDTFPVIDSCQCYRHTPAEIVVDLSPAAFVQFAPLSRGVVMVTLTVLR